MASPNNLNPAKVKGLLEQGYDTITKTLNEAKNKVVVFPFITVLGEISTDSRDYHPLNNDTPQDVQTQSVIFTGDSPFLVK